MKTTIFNNVLSNDFFSMGQFREKSYSTYRDGGSGGDRRTHKYSPPQIFRPSANLDIYIVEKKNPPINKLFCGEQIVTSKEAEIENLSFCTKVVTSENSHSSMTCQLESNKDLNFKLGVCIYIF